METKYTPKPIDTKGVELPVELSVLAEEIAKNVHEVWSQNRMNDGWTYGEQRDDAKKTHPCLVAYEELSDSEKEYDRATSQETIKLILKLGFEITKKEINKITMSNILDNTADELLKAMNSETDHKKEGLLKSINNHALNSAGLGLIPVPLADLAAVTVNVWHMYVKINKILGISFSDNFLKSVASAALANLSGNLIGSGLASMLKFIPGGAIAASIIVAGTNYAITFSSAWIYLHALTIMAKENINVDSEDGAKKLIRNIKDSKKEQRKIASEAKSNYVEEHKNDK